MTDLDDLYVSFGVTLTLPEVVEHDGELWHTPERHHVSVFTGDELLELAPLEDLARAAQVACGWPLRFDDLFDDVWRCQAKGRRTLVARCRVAGLDELYAHLRATVSAALPAPPAHITVYVEPGGRGIGLTTERAFAAACRKTSLRVADLLR